MTALFAAGLATGLTAQVVSSPSSSTNSEPDLRSTHIVRTIPTQGESGVGIAQPSAVFLNRAVDASTVGPQSISAIVGGSGTQLTIDASLSLDRRVLTITYPNELPAEETIQLTLDGSVLQDDNGLGVDVDGDGSPGGVFTLTFQTRELDPPLPSGTMTITGRVFEYDANGNAVPAQGAVIESVYFPTFDGAPTLPAPPAFSGSDGRFTYLTPEITGMVEILVRVRRPGFSEALRPVTALANGCWQVQDAFLQPLTAPVLVMPGQAMTLTDMTGQAELIIPGDALNEASMISLTILESAEFLRDELPSLTSRDGVYVDIAGVFGDQTNTPVTLCVPNTYDLPVGTLIPFGKVDHNTLEWIDMQDLTGPGEDPFIGEVVDNGDGTTEVRVEFTHFCSVCTGYCLNLSQGDTDGSGDDNGCGGSGGPGNSYGNSVVNRREGHLYEFLNLPSFYEFGEERAFGFGYASGSASPSATLTGIVDYGTTRPVERTIFEFDIEGVLAEAAYGFSSNNLKPHATYIWDGRNGLGNLVPTGSYPYTVNTTSLNANAAVSVPSTFGGLPTQVFPGIEFPGITELPADPIERRASIINLQDSSYGAGWSFLNEARLHLMPDGCLLLVEGNADWRDFLPNESQANEWVPPGGEVSTITWNGSFGLYERVMPDDRRQVFNGAGRIVADIDRFGNTTSYLYAGGRLAQLVTPTGFSLTFAYDLNDKLASVADSAGRTTTFVVDTSGDLTSWTSAEAATITFGYDANHLLESITGSRGQKSTYQYEFGRIAAVEAFDTDGTTLLRRREFQPSVLTGEIKTSQAQGLGFINSPIPVYQDWNNAMLDGRGFVSTGTSNFQGLPLTEVDGLQRVTSYEYDENQMPSVVRRPDGTRTEMDFDASGQVTTMREYTSTGSQFSTSTMEYGGPFGEMTRIVNPAGRQTTFGHDTSGNLTSIVDHDGKATTIEFLDPVFVHLPSRVSLHSGDVVDYTYDSHGNLATLTDYPDPFGNPSGRTMGFTRDFAGNIVSRSDDDGRVDSFTWDDVGRLLTHTDGLSRTTIYSYLDTCHCAQDGFAGVQFHNSTSISYAYDGLGRMVARTDQLGASSSFEYDSEGNITSYTDRNGDTLLYAYDGAGQLVRKELPGQDVTVYEYDDRGELVRAEDADCLIEFEHDTMGRVRLARTRLVEELTGGFTVPLDHQIVYGYDTSGRRSSMNSGGGAATFSYSYDNVSRLGSMSLGGTPSASWIFGYDDAGRKASLLRTSSSTTSTYLYDGASQLASLTHSLTSPIAQMFTAFNGSGDALAAQLVTSSDSYAQSFVNDNARRLVSASYGVTLGETEVDRTYAYDAANRLQSDQDATYIHDAEGRLVQRTSGTRVEDYAYDAEGQLTSYSETIDDGTPEVVLSVVYSYDPLGRRVEKNINGVVERFVFDGADVLHKLDGKNRVELTFVHGPGVDDVLAVRDSVTGEIFEFLQDRLGTPIAVSNSAGLLVQETLYDEFGTLAGRTGTGLPHPYGFTGRQFDPESGLHYYRARYFDAGVGRFLAEDPLDVTAGLNLYAYVGSNPVNYTDPTGELVWFAAPLIGAALGAAIDVGFQLWGNGGRFDCINLGRVGTSALLGAAGGLAGAAAKGALAARAGNGMVNVSRWGRPGIQGGDWVMKGGANRWNYFWSGKWQPRWMPGGNLPASRISGQTFQVPRSSLQWPKGFGVDGWIKGLLGQRKYIP